MKALLTLKHSLTRHKPFLTPPLPLPLIKRALCLPTVIKLSLTPEPPNLPVSMPDGP